MDYALIFVIGFTAFFALCMFVVNAWEVYRGR